jgi:hypothetical protein
VKKCLFVLALGFLFAVGSNTPPQAQLAPLRRGGSFFLSTCDMEAESSKSGGDITLSEVLDFRQSIGKYGDSPLRWRGIDKMRVIL